MNQEVWGLLRLPMYICENAENAGSLPCLKRSKLHSITVHGRGTVVCTEPHDKESHTPATIEIARNRMLQPKHIQTLQGLVHRDIMLLTVKIFFKMIDSLPCPDAHDWRQQDTMVRAYFRNQLHLTQQDVANAQDREGHYLRYMYVPVSDNFAIGDILQCISNEEGWNQHYYNATIVTSGMSIDMTPTYTTRSLLKLANKLRESDTGPIIMQVIGPCRKCPSCLEPCIDGHTHHVPT